AGGGSGRAEIRARLGKEGRGSDDTLGRRAERPVLHASFAEMLDFFRQRGLSNVIYGAIMVATIMAFVITFRPNATSKTASLKETCVARVRGRCVDPKDFTSAYRILMPSRSSTLSRKLNLKRLALDGLIERELLDDEARRLNVAVTDAEVTDQLYAGFVRV